jgi:hypothetical protein
MKTGTPMPLLHGGKGRRQHDLVHLIQQVLGASPRRPQTLLHGLGTDRRALVEAMIGPDMNKSIGLAEIDIVYWRIS